MDKEVILLLTGELVEIIQSVSPKAYQDYMSVGKIGKNDVCAAKEIAVQLPAQRPPFFSKTTKGTLDLKIRCQSI